MVQIVDRTQNANQTQLQTSSILTTIQNNIVKCCSSEHQVIVCSRGISVNSSSKPQSPSSRRQIDNGFISFYDPQSNTESITLFRLSVALELRTHDRKEHLFK